MTVLQMIVAKSSPNVYLDWSLDGTSGPFVLKRSLSFTFSNPVYLGPAQTTKTFDDPVANNTQGYAYEAFRRTLTDTLYFYHADHLGTPIAMTNGAGSLVWRAEHTPFSDIYALTVGTITNNLRFPGQYYDGETGLAQNYFRDYKHNTGRYWEPDPANQLSGTKYHYSQNDPITRSDFQGLKVQLCCRPVKAPLSGIWNLLGVAHCWLQTDSKTAGMGDVGGNAAWWEPLARNVPVQVTDQSSEHGNCETIPCMDEGCVNNELQIGRPLGNFGYVGNNCQTFANSVIRKCHSCCKLPPAPPIPPQHWPGGFY